MGFLTRKCVTAILVITLSTIANLEEPIKKPGINVEEGEVPDIVNTQSGPVSGVKLKTAGDNFVQAYFGIPYAKPPLGELRFQAPRKVENWRATLKAVRPLPFCYQDIPAKAIFVRETKASMQRPWTEDCLTLNIWSPSPKPQKAPVIVFIHGGAFIFGGSTWLIDGTALALEGVILVSINYRLGVFGFLNLGHTEVPGNAGLMDQNLGLQWVRDNIEAFGGDSESITLMGMSAGSASVGYHLLSPMSKGLFKRAILMSGVPTNPWAIREPEESIDRAKKLLDEIGCPKENTTLALQCLRGKHAEDLLTACNTEHIMTSEHFLPTVDGKFVVEHPSISAITGKFNTEEVLIGTVKEEGGSFLIIGNLDLFKTKDGRLYRRDFLKVIKRSQRDLSDLHVEALNVLYTNWSIPDDPIMLRDAAKDMYGDASFACHVNEFADNVARMGIPVYRYAYDYKVAMLSMSQPSWVGATHGSDQLPVIGPSQLSNYLDKTDGKAFQRFRSHIVNFAKQGDPNLIREDFPGEPHWPQYNSGKQYLLFSKSSTVHNNMRSRECAAWLKLLPLLDGKQTC